MSSARIRRLTLTNFRSYHAAQIEAISLLTPGRGLRRATLEDVAFAEGDGAWAVAAEVEGALGLATLGTGIERPLGEAEVRARKCRIDREPVTSAAAFADHLRV